MLHIINVYWFRVQKLNRYIYIYIRISIFKMENKISGSRNQYEIKERFNYFFLKYWKMHSIQLYVSKIYVQFFFRNLFWIKND
jgi:hypothetical protein